MIKKIDKPWRGQKWKSILYLYVRKTGIAKMGKLLKAIYQIKYYCCQTWFCWGVWLLGRWISWVVLAAPAWRSRFDLQCPHKKLPMVLRACSPSTGNEEEVEPWVSLACLSILIAKSPGYSNRLTNNQGSWLLSNKHINKVDLLPSQACEHMYMCIDTYVDICMCTRAYTRMDARFCCYDRAPWTKAAAGGQVHCRLQLSVQHSRKPEQELRQD